LPLLWQVSSIEQESNVNGRFIINHSFKKLKFEDNVLKILKSSCSNSTWRQYESSLKKWAMFCEQNQWNVFAASISNYLSFLADLYDQGLSYNTINTARSALSSVFDPIVRVAV